MVHYISTHPTYQPRSGRKAAVLSRLIANHVILERDDGTHEVNPAVVMETWDPEAKEWIS